MKTLIFNLIFSFLLVLPTLSPADGLTGDYYNNDDFTNFQFTRVDSTIDFSWGSGSPDSSMGSNYFSVTWSGWIYIPENSNYTFSLAHDDVFTLVIDGTTVYDSNTWTGGSNIFRDATSRFFNEGYYSISISFVEWGGGAYSRLAWRNSNSIGSNTIIPTSNLFTVLPTPTVPPTVTPSTLSISENAQIGDIVGTVVATQDPTSFAIISGADGKFEIDGNGVITVLDTLDFETDDQYTLEVTATNAIGNSTAATIIINILDESAPTSYDQNFNVDETAANNDFIGTIVTTGSPDTFSITSGDPDDTFKVDENGTIRVNDNTNLDAAVTPLYTLLMHISSPEGTVDITVTINVDSTLPTGNDNRRAFTNVSLFGNDSISINGNILLIGNQLLCQNDSDGDTCTAPTVGINNNSVNQHKAKIDTSAGAPDSNTWAKLTLEDGTTTLSESDEIIFARLYWSARINESTVDDAEKNEARTIQIKGPTSSSYTTLTSPVSRFNWFKVGSVFDYSASQDVTAYVKSNGDGNYSVGGIKATNGSNMFAAWALIVIVQNPERDLNNLSIYDGFQAIYTGNGYPDSVTVPASGFLTPVGTEPFGASLFVFTGESESNLNDTAEIQNSSGVYNNLTDGYNDTNDVFNASIYTPENGFRSSQAGEANPNFQNVVGTDIDKLEVNRKADSLKQFLDNTQTSTNIRISSGGDRYTLNMFAFETELHYPKMCYDYSYSQDGYIYTEFNDGTEYPNIDIPTNSGNPITVAIYIRSEDSDVDFDHISLYSDFNLSTIAYAGSFQRTQVNAFGYDNTETEATSSNCLESSSANRICKTTAPNGNFRVGVGRPSTSGSLGYPLMSAGSLGNDDFMYFKYLVNPTNSAPIKTPLKLLADIQYSLSTGSTAVDPVYGLPFGGDRMPLCPPSTSYTPEWGMFNVIDTQLNISKTGYSGSRYLNNLLTQVSERSFSADVVAYDPVSSPPNTPKDINTSIAVELVDIKGFHDVNISCKESANRFSERVYLNFSEDNRKTISSLTTAYAKEDAAYRIWYIHDGNTSRIITNWSSITDGSGALTGISNLYEQIPTAPAFCGVACDGPQSPAQIRNADCYECLRSHFGYPLCSRDNFAIRPESYKISLGDSNTSSSLNITENTLSQDNGNFIATGYAYVLDINSTNHIDSNNTIGYKKQFLESLTETSYISLNWIDLGKTCNDESDYRHGVLISNGSVINYPFLHDEAGIYNLKILDDEWTRVDQGQPTHHINNEYWITNVDDCIVDNSTVLDTLATTTLRSIGCNISSTHTVDRSVTLLNPLAYSDLNVTFRPYTLNIDNIVISYGTDFNTTFATTQPFSYVYMSDLSQESNMSLNAIGNIRAEGKNGNVVTNFTNNCYAEDLEIILDTNLSLFDDSGLFAHRYLDLNSTSNTTIDDNTDFNTTVMANDVFQDDANGISQLRLHYNYDRNISNALNPKQLLLKEFKVKCFTDLNCAMTADQNITHSNESANIINSRLNFYYGRNHSPRYRFTDNNGTAFIYYEVFCSGANCNTALLQDGANSNTTDDPRWFVNTQHSNGFGSAKEIIQPNAPIRVTGTTATGNHQDSSFILYDGSRNYPYKTTMDTNSSSWLIYNKYNVNATRNSFDVEFMKSDNSWAGVHETDTNTKKKAAIQTNRRTMW